MQWYVLVPALVNTKDLVNSVLHDLKLKGIHIMYKFVQKKKFSSHCCLLSVLDRFNLAGLEHTFYYSWTIRPLHMHKNPFSN